MPLAVFIAVCIANLLFVVGVVCLPLPDEGPHVANGWGQAVRLRHLYAARHGLHLLISGDGSVRGSADQTLYSLMEIRPVGTGCIVIKGLAASQFLCMERNGRLYSSSVYTRDDCTFREQILPDGYNTYVSNKHGTLVSLGSHRQTLQGRDRGAPALSQFLPRISTLDPAITHRLAEGLEPGEQSEQDPPQIQQDAEDTMDSLGRLSQIFIHSPSFNKR